MKSENTIKNIEQNIPVAIIGMSCLFPKSPGVKEYWRLLFHGMDGISEVPESHWSPDDYFDVDPKSPDHVYCRRGGFLSPVSFDPTEFGIPPSSLEATDTSQLLGLMAAKMALDDSGYGEGRDFEREKTSVILGVTGTQELVIPLGSRLGHPKWRKALEEAGVPDDQIELVVNKISDSYVPWQENSFPGLLGNVVAGRICNRLNLGGTNCVVDAACASSMSAIHLALLELSTGRSEMVITGGVDTINDVFMHMCFSKTQILSPTEDIRPFSKNADGTVLGEGVGILVLKRLVDAEKDGDHIYAVIKSIGSSSDGKSQSIYAPRSEGQASSIRMAHHLGNVESSSIGLIEAHGTGTRVGDMVEVSALKQIFQESERSDFKCALGSVKSMIGHTKAAAGTAGTIKAALSLYHKILPPTLKSDPPDPALDLSSSPFYINTRTKPWLSDTGHPRRAGVSSFGFGGSNFHMVLEEHRTEKNTISWDGSIEIAAMSAPTKKELSVIFNNFKQSAENNASDHKIAALAAKSRETFSSNDSFRLLLILERSTEGFIDLPGLFERTLKSLESASGKVPLNERNIYIDDGENPGKIAFVFPGQGSQYTWMGRDLICFFPKALRMLETANIKFSAHGTLSDYIYPIPSYDPHDQANPEFSLRCTDIAQPALGAVSAAFDGILKDFGINPDVTCGHSYGELTALYSAGWYDLETFFELSISRGQLMSSASGSSGGMLAVRAPLEDLSSLVKDSGQDVVLANRNSPDQGVLSGSIEGINKLKMICESKGYITSTLPVSAAFHSHLVEQAQQPFSNFLKTLHLKPSGVPVFSNTTGKPYPEGPERVKDLLGEQLANPVNFNTQIENIHQSGVRTFVEVGPKSVLSGLVKSILKDKEFSAIPMDPSSGKDFGLMDLACTMCRLASLGHPVELSKWEDPRSKERKQMMNVPLSGANYRNEKSESRPAMKPFTAGDKANSLPGSDVSQMPGAVVNSLNAQSVNKEGKEGTMSRRRKAEDIDQKSDFIPDALQIFQDGLK